MPERHRPGKDDLPVGARTAIGVVLAASGVAIGILGYFLAGPLFTDPSPATCARFGVMVAALVFAFILVVKFIGRKLLLWQRVEAGGAGTAT
jgi:hypothetical protein